MAEIDLTSVWEDNQPVTLELVPSVARSADGDGESHTGFAEASTVEFSVAVSRMDGDGASVTVVIQESEDGSSWSTIATLGPLRRPNATDSETLTRTFYDYLRATWTVSGGTVAFSVAAKVTAAQTPWAGAGAGLPDTSAASEGDTLVVGTPGEPPEYGNILALPYTVGGTDIEVGMLVKPAGGGTIQPGGNGDRDVLGVALQAGAEEDTIDVQVAGVMTLTAEGSISAGRFVVLADTEVSPDTFEPRGRVRQSVDMHVAGSFNGGPAGQQDFSLAYDYLGFVTLRQFYGFDGDGLTDLSAEPWAAVEDAGLWLDNTGGTDLTGLTVLCFLGDHEYLWAARALESASDGETFLARLL